VTTVPEHAANAIRTEPTASDAAVVAALAYVLPEPPAPDERNPEYATKLRALCEASRPAGRIHPINILKL
jgi:hypothetical protein